MMLACHQPLFLPWPGLFYKSMHVDLLVLLDDVPFPMGTTWISRNRIKNESGPFWLTVPIKKKGHRSAPINTMQIFNERDWRKKHLSAIKHAYTHAPYLEEYLPFFSDLYNHPWEKLIELNVNILEYLKDALHINTPFSLSSSLDLSERGSNLLIKICQQTGIKTYCASWASRKYLDESAFKKAGLSLKYYRFVPPIYPQLWGDFVANLSAVDMLFCCGAKSNELISQSGSIHT
jgi:hypothetical protein